MYVLRLLIDEPLPLNEGLLEPVAVTIPEGLLNPPFSADPTACPAVAGGNVEISQLLVEAMLTAFGAGAQSQGTMNNVIFGNESFGFYETLGGGAGALAAFPGESAVHTHMTNTHLSDIEILEHAFPVRVLRCLVRRGSGGAGAARGGDGIERLYEFLTDLDASVLAERRVIGPRGLAGGSQGLPGDQELRDPFGGVLAHPFTAGRVRRGQLLRVLTPGGGGVGPPR
jgi:5-oxoprolinase (ATP-hydrolysing)